MPCFSTFNICWFNCLISVQDHALRTKIRFLVTFALGIIIIIVLRLCSGHDVYNIQSSHLKYFVVYRQTNSNAPASTISSLSICISLLYQGSINNCHQFSIVENAFWSRSSCGSNKRQVAFRSSRKTSLSINLYFPYCIVLLKQVVSLKILQCKQENGQTARMSLVFR